MSAVHLGALAPVIGGAFGLQPLESGSHAPVLEEPARPASRSAHMRPRVAPVVASPPPGSYAGPLKIRLQCDTGAAEVRYTRDGSTPYPNSDRDHGYRCERYSPATGILLAGKGRHVLTIVATAANFVEARPLSLVYRITSGPEPKKPRAEAIREAAMNRQFDLASSHEVSMPFERARTPGTSGTRARLALAETVNARALERMRKEGQRVELFKLTADSGRTTAYKRVVPPSLSVSVPQDPLRSRPPSAAPSLASGPHGVNTPLTKPLSYAHFGQTEGTAVCTTLVPADTALTVSRPASRALTPFASGRSRRPPSRAPSAPVAKRPARAATPTGSSQSTAQQLMWFETRSEITAADPDDDAEDLAAEAQYREKGANAVESEVLRVGRVSNKFERTYATPAPVTADIASESRRLLGLLVQASEAKRSPLRQLLVHVSYADIHRLIDRRSSVTPVELSTAVKGACAQPDIARGLRQIGASSGEPDAKTSIAVPHLELMLRYLVWVHRPVPEAVLALAVQYKAALPVPADRIITRVEAVALVDAYRRTRGAHPLAVAQLTDAVHSGLKWSESGDVELEQWQAAMAAIPLVDASLTELAQVDHPMYSQQLRPS
jgi:hypothetical protein